MDSNPLVSIITPTYNRSDLLSLAIESVLAQTYRNYELIIIDDGSIDNTAKVVKSYSSSGKILYQYQENSGQATARNNGLRQSSGEFICFLDSDNLYYEDKLEEQVEYLLKNPDVDIIYGDEDIIEQDGDLITKNNMRRYSGLIYEKLLLDNCVSMNTAMVRRRCFDETGGFDESIIVADDYDLWLRFSVKYKFHYENKYFAKYRIMSDQISSDKNKRFDSNLNIITEFMKNNADIITTKKRKHFMCRYYVRRGRYHASISEYKEAIHNYFMSLRYEILSIAPWRALLKLVILRK